MKKAMLYAAFIAAAAAQLAVPAWMIVQREITLRTGELCRLRVEPIDPYDPFHGRYITLNVATNPVPIQQGQHYQQGDKAFVILAEAEEGYHRLDRLVQTRPGEGPYMPATVLWVQETGEGQVATARLRLPVDRFYMEERKAPLAERILWQNAGGPQEVYVAARIRSGYTVIENVYVDGLPISEYVTQQTGTESLPG